MSFPEFAHMASAQSYTIVVGFRTKGTTNRGNEITVMAFVRFGRCQRSMQLVAHTCRMPCTWHSTASPTLTTSPAPSSSAKQILSLRRHRSTLCRAAHLLYRP